MERQLVRFRRVTHSASQLLLQMQPADRLKQLLQGASRQLKMILVRRLIRLPVSTYLV